MKKLLFTFLLLASVTGQEVVTPPTLRFREIDGTPTGLARTVEVSNGTLSFPGGSVARINTGGGGGGNVLVNGTTITNANFVDSATATFAVSASTNVTVNSLDNNWRASGTTNSTLVGNASANWVRGTNGGLFGTIAALSSTTALLTNYTYTGAIDSRTVTLPTAANSIGAVIHYVGTAAANTIITWPGSTVRQGGRSGYIASTLFPAGNVEFILYADGTDWYLEKIGMRALPVSEQLTDAATVTILPGYYDAGYLTSVSQTTTIAAPSGTFVNFQKYSIRFTSSSARSLVWTGGTGGFTNTASLALPTTTTGSSQEDEFVWEYSAQKNVWKIVGSSVGTP